MPLLSGPRRWAYSWTAASGPAWFGAGGELHPSRSGFLQEPAQGSLRPAQLRLHLVHGKRGW